MTSAKSSDNTPFKQKRVYGRQQSRPLGVVAKSAMDTRMPTLSVPEDDLKEDGNLSPARLFGNDNPVWMEIGFGAGEHVIGLLEQQPDINMLAVEPYTNGMATFVKNLPEDDIPRTRVLMDDAMLLANSLGDASIERLYILNPDPWHKKRHHKRRIVNPDNLDAFARILKPGGELILTTDVPYLADWMLTHTYKHPAFEWRATSQADWTQAPKDWITTRYEVKGAKGASQMSYMFFKRI